MATIRICYRVSNSCTRVYTISCVGIIFPNEDVNARHTILWSIEAVMFTIHSCTRDSEPPAMINCFRLVHTFIQQACDECVRDAYDKRVPTRSNLLVVCPVCVERHSNCCRAYFQLPSTLSSPRYPSAATVL